MTTVANTAGGCLRVVVVVVVVALAGPVTSTNTSTSTTTDAGGAAGGGDDTATCSLTTHFTGTASTAMTSRTSSWTRLHEETGNSS